MQNNKSIYNQSHFTEDEERGILISSVAIMILCVLIGLICILYTTIIPPTAHAFDADIYAGMYFDSTYASSPLRDGSTAKYMNGISVGHNIGKLRGYVNVETLSDQYNNDGSFHPDSIRYRTGLRYNIWKGLSVDAEHMCWHPIDGAGRVEQYNLIKVNYHFGEPNKW